MYQIHARFVRPDVRQLLQRGQLDAGGIAGVATRIEEVSGHHHHVEHLLEGFVVHQICGKDEMGFQLKLQSLHLGIKGFLMD